MSLQPLWEMLDSEAVPPEAVPWLLVAILILVMLMLCARGDE